MLRTDRSVTCRRLRGLVTPFSSSSIATALVKLCWVVGRSVRGSFTCCTRSAHTSPTRISLVSPGARKGLKCTTLPAQPVPSVEYARKMEVMRDASQTEGAGMLAVGGTWRWRLRQRHLRMRMRACVPSRLPLAAPMPHSTLSAC